MIHACSTPPGAIPRVVLWVRGNLGTPFDFPTRLSDPRGCNIWMQLQLEDERTLLLTDAIPVGDKALE